MTELEQFRAMLNRVGIEHDFSVGSRGTTWLIITDNETDSWIEVAFTIDGKLLKLQSW